MYGKMFLILGIPWVFEGIHFFSHQKYQHGCHPGGFSETFFRIVSIFNFSRGIFLFLIFVCKKTVWVELKKIKWINTVSSKLNLTKENMRERRKTFVTELDDKDMVDKDLKGAERDQEKTSPNEDENKMEMAEENTKQRVTNLIVSTRV